MPVALNSLLKHQSSYRMLCFSFLSSTKWHPLGSSFRGPKYGSRRALNWDCWEDKGELFILLLQLPLLCTEWSGVVMWEGGGLVSSPCSAKPFTFIVLTYLISDHIILVWIDCGASCQESSQISLPTLSLIPVVAATSGHTLRDVPSLPFWLILKQCTQRLS